jgi:hypothetical protein
VNLLARAKRGPSAVDLEVPFSRPGEVDVSAFNWPPPLAGLSARQDGGRLVKHARYYWLLLAESHLTRRLFGSMLHRIWALPVPTG